MTAIEIERNREFLKDLRANRKKAVGRLHDESGGHCCLGVACNTARRLGLVFEEKNHHLPPLIVVSFFGWPCQNPPVFWKGEKEQATVWNDGARVKGLTHAEIAEAFEATWPQLLS